MIYVTIYHLKLSSTSHEIERVSGMMVQSKLLFVLTLVFKEDIHQLLLVLFHFTVILGSAFTISEKVVYTVLSVLSQKSKL